MSETFETIVFRAIGVSMEQHLEGISSTENILMFHKEDFCEQNLRDEIKDYEIRYNELFLLRETIIKEINKELDWRNKQKTSTTS